MSERLIPTGGGQFVYTTEQAKQVETLAMRLWEAREIDPPLTNGQAWAIAYTIVMGVQSDGSSVLGWAPRTEEGAGEAATSPADHQLAQFDGTPSASEEGTDGR